MEDTAPTLESRTIDSRRLLDDVQDRRLSRFATTKYWVKMGP